MTKSEFLDTLRRRLAGLPEDEIDDVIADYSTHFADGLASGRSEEEIARALGDPLRLARELRAEAGFRRWESKRSVGNFAAVLFGFLALVAVDFVFLLPVLISLAFFTFIAGIIAMGLCIAGLVLMMNIFHITRIITGVALLGFGIGGGALLLLLVDAVVRMLTKFARLHYSLLDRADLAT